MASAGLAAGAGEILNAQTLSSSKNKNEKVKIAYVGIGNRGQQIIEDFARTGMVEVVALCDVDMGAKHTQKVIGMYPSFELEVVCFRMSLVSYLCSQIRTFERCLHQKFRFIESTC